MAYLEFRNIHLKYDQRQIFSGFNLEIEQYDKVLFCAPSGRGKTSLVKMLLGFENGKKVPYHLGHFFMAIDINAFTELSEFQKTTGNILRDLRASKKAPGHDRIYTAGEKEYLAWMERKDSGIPVNQELQREILTLQQELGLTQYQFPFSETFG